MIFVYLKSCTASRPLTLEFSCAPYKEPTPTNSHRSPGQLLVYVRSL